MWWDENTVWAYNQSEMRDTKPTFLNVYIPRRATHWISFLCQVSFSLCSILLLSVVLVGPIQRVSWTGVTPTYLSSLPVWGGGRKKEQMNVRKHHPVVSVPKNPKCKNVMNVWLKVSLAGLHISDSFVYQRKTVALKKAVRFAVVYIYKVMFIQYFNITSDFRGRYLNMILYLTCKMSTAVYWYSAAIYNKGFLIVFLIFV